MNVRCPAAGAALVFVVVSADFAHAEPKPKPSDAVAADKLFVQGRAAVERGDYETACEKFELSQRLDPAPGTVLNLADCNEHRGRRALAWQEYRDVVAALPARDPRVPVANERIAALEKKLAKLTLRLAEGAPLDAVVERDGVEVKPRDFGSPTLLDPGDHEVRVTAGDRPERRTIVRLAEGEAKDIVVAPAPLPRRGSETVSRGAGNHDEHVDGADGRSKRTLGYWIAGGGAVVAAAGGVLLYLSKTQHDEVRAACSGDTCTDGQTQSHQAKEDTAATNGKAGIVAAGLGGAGVLVGVIMALTAVPNASAGIPEHVAVSATPGGGFVGFGGAW